MHAISADTRLSQLFEAVPDALDYIVALNPHDFERLRHPVLRRYMSSRISLRRVAAMVQMPEERLLADLRRLARGEPLAAVQPTRAPHPAPPPSVPSWLEHVDPASIPWVDVVPIDDVSGDPFPPISLAVKQLPPGGVLGIRHRWEPQPLYDVWAKMHLAWFAQRIGEREWYIFVHRPPSIPAFPSKPVIGAQVGGLPETEVLPRLQVLAEQLEVGQTVEATGLPGGRLASLRDALRQQLGAGYHVEDGPSVLRVTHLAA
jgi:hypothetical protein